MLKELERRAIPCTSYPFCKRNSVKYEPSCPVIPVINATLRGGVDEEGGEEGAGMGKGVRKGEVGIGLGMEVGLVRLGMGMGLAVGWVVWLLVSVIHGLVRN